MTQYLLKKDPKLKELVYALNNYDAKRIVISAFSLGRRTNMNAIGGNIGGSLELKISNNWEFYVNKKELIQINPHDDRGFKLEYQDDKYFRIFPYFDNPNDPKLDNLVKYSTFRDVVDDYLIEIFFKGKIPLELDKKINSTDFWKIKK
jgi:aromatic ring-cleaving dioxygenase